MRLVTALVTFVALLVGASSALAGGWASVTLEATPTGIGAGDTWNAQLTVLRHGITPTDGAEPSVTIRNDVTGAEQTFRAEPTGDTGVYAAAVVFPESGEWRYSVNDGLAATGYGISQVTEYPPVTVTGSTGGGGVSEFPVAPVLVALAAALAFCAAIYAAVRRQRRLTPASR
jgi:hypothetical protein